MKINRRRFIEASALTMATSMVSASVLVGEQKKGGRSRGSQPKSLSSQDSKIQPLLSQMTLEEKVGQMVQAEQSALKDISDIEKYFLGSLLSGGMSDPKNRNNVSGLTEVLDSLSSRNGETH